MKGLSKLINIIGEITSRATSSECHPGALTKKEYSFPFNLFFVNSQFMSTNSKSLIAHSKL